MDEEGFTVLLDLIEPNPDFPAFQQCPALRFESVSVLRGGRCRPSLFLIGEREVDRDVHHNFDGPAVEPRRIALPLADGIDGGHRGVRMNVRPQRANQDHRPVLADDRVFRGWHNARSQPSAATRPSGRTPEGPERGLTPRCQSGG